MVHRGIQAFLMRTSVESAVNSVIEETDATKLNQEAIDALQVSKAKAMGALDAYVQLYQSDRTRYDLVQTEKKFNIVLVKDPLILYQVTIDMLARDNEGWHIIDHKTADTISDSYLQHASISSQTLGYSFAARKLLDEWPTSIVYNIIGKTKLRRYKKGKTRKREETLKEYCARIYKEYMDSLKPNAEKKYFLREEFKLKKDRVRQWYHDTIRIALQMWKDYQEYKETENSSIFYKNTGACYRFFKSCPYLECCAVGGRLTGGIKMLYDQGEDSDYIKRLHEEAPTVD